MIVRKTVVALVLANTLLVLGYLSSTAQALRGVTYSQLHSRSQHVPTRSLQQQMDPQRCTDLLVPLLPKVALMFLVLDEMPHEDIWTRWLVRACCVVC